MTGVKFVYNSLFSQSITKKWQISYCPSVHRFFLIWNLTLNIQNFRFTEIIYFIIVFGAIWLFFFYV